MAHTDGSKKATGKAVSNSIAKGSTEQSAQKGDGLATDLNEMIAVAAYYRAQNRQFEPGHELEDWLAAENEIKNGGATVH